MSATDALYNDSLWEEFAQVDAADVAVDNDAPDLQPTYTYRVPESMRSIVVPGSCVHVPFHGRELLGYVTERRRLSVTDPLCAKLKDLIGVVEGAITINDEQMRLVRWMSERYICDLPMAIRCVAPAILGSKVVTLARLANENIRADDAGGSMPQAHVVETLRSLGGDASIETLRTTSAIDGFSSAYAALIKKGLIVETRGISRPKTVAITTTAYALGAAASTLSGRVSLQQRRVLDVLIERSRNGGEPLPRQELLDAADVKIGSIKSLVDNGLIVESKLTLRRAPVKAGKLRTEPPALTPGQAAAATALRRSIQAGKFETMLLFGVTASGKTEVYLNAITQTLALGRSAIVLVPEIALTAQVVDVFTGRFGEQVAVLHSRLSDGERHDEWRRMQSGEAKIVVGARSAIFAPVRNVGLIVIDEEHEASYKQESTPRYNAKELAAERARFSGATLLLGSATPSLETFHSSENGVTRLEMPHRIGNRPLPRVHVVDLREEMKTRKALFSQMLVDGMADRLRRKQQVILFLNRRGYAQFVLCRACGYVARCPNCAVSLAYHSFANVLKCHHCDYVKTPPQTCPECGTNKVKAFGVGTEKVEEEALSTFPEAKIARMDRDTTSAKGAHGRIISDFRRGDAEILIGTQMVAKGLDFPNVTLVGVISADTALNMPDFRAAERSFQLLTQVAGRSGRGVEPGEVIIQTFNPEHYAVAAATHQDYPKFYKQEILFRKELNYPPFSRFANLIFSDERESMARSRAEALAVALSEVVPKTVEILGPAPAPLARLKTLWRFHVALRGPVDTPMSDLVRSALARLPSGGRLGLSIDMDPLSMN